MTAFLIYVIAMNVLEVFCAMFKWIWPVDYVFNTEIFSVHFDPSMNTTML